MVTETTLKFVESLSGNLDTVTNILILGEKKFISSEVNQRLNLVFTNEKIVINQDLLEPLNEDSCKYINQFVKTDSKLVEIAFAKIDSRKSRNLGVIRFDSAADIVAKHLNKEKDSCVIVLIDNADQARSIGAAISRVYPPFTKKTGKVTKRTVVVNFVVNDNSNVDYEEIQTISNAIRLASRLGDTPAEEMNPIQVIKESEEVISRLKKLNRDVKINVIKGEELQNLGFGGIYSVGKGSKYSPALIILQYTKPGNIESIAWVGKGITFDTGGLCIKSRDSMCGMKQDMDGTASVLAAFEAAATLNLDINVYGILCVAENTPGQYSFRPDDILTLYSGKTVEINNTDAEGRLVISDGVCYATRNLKADYVMDIATLTGAQSYATGFYHSGVLTPSETFEKQIIDAGKLSGDLCYPLIYCPEFLGIDKQYYSPVADMKNSVKARNNAASSCAGHFVEEHIDKEWKENQCNKYGEGEFMWAHLDVAYPAVDSSDRATGFGVPLFIEIAKKLIDSE
jgi:probable aminopeptidase NPEPL1